MQERAALVILAPGWYRHAFLLLVATLATDLAFAAKASKPISQNLRLDDPLTWPGSNPFEFGCFLEKTLAVSDATYSCAVLNGTPVGDHLNSSGPYIPQDKMKSIKLGIQDVTLTWEKMRLQEVSLTLNKKLTPAQILKFLGILSLKKPRANVALVKANDCGDRSCLLLQNKTR